MKAKVCKANDLPESTMKSFDVEGEPLLVAHVGFVALLGSRRRQIEEPGYAVRKAVSVGLEGARCLGRGIDPGGEGVDRSEAAHRFPVDLLCPTANYCVL